MGHGGTERAPMNIVFLQNVFAGNVFVKLVNNSAVYGFILSFKIQFFLNF